MAKEKKLTKAEWQKENQKEGIQNQMKAIDAKIKALTERKKFLEKQSENL